jgi:polysaccharide pyruvyl transferase WcaK-like protein
LLDTVVQPNKGHHVKILIDNGDYELLNFGDIAMLQVAVLRLGQCYPEAELLVFTSSPERLKKYCPTAVPVAKAITLEGRRVWKLPWNIFGSLHKLLPNQNLKRKLALLEFKVACKYSDKVRPWVTSRLKPKGFDVVSMGNALDLIKSVDMVVATGGGYITDAFESSARGVLMTLATAHALGKPTALFGQGLGPINGFLRDIARFCLRQIDVISLREKVEGLPLLNDLNIPQHKVTVTGDDAIEYAYSNKPDNLGSDIGINIRIAYYSKLAETDVNNIVPFLQQIKGVYNAKLRPIPISTHSEESDLASIKRTFGDILDFNGDNLNSPLDVIQEIGRCRIVITGSYHAAVFALSQGISAVCLARSLYYHQKFQGVAEQFGCGCYIVDMNDAHFVDNFQSAVETAWTNADKVTEQLKTAAGQQIALGLQTYAKFGHIKLYQAD